MIAGSHVGSWITAIGVGMLIVAAAPRPADAQMWIPGEVSGGYVYLAGWRAARCD
jgi:hypothetical protein